MGEVHGYIEERRVLECSESAIPREMDSSRPSTFPTDFLARCPEQFKERSRKAAKNAAVATAQ